ncbi:hypothetical protein GCM10009117_07280 [Gangjinia marincola]|uniref:Uncharacterized protein n=1 Tax=Gangjinia marincola TaxID=578463 RepID=A0ABP3XTI7_9FLAO
MKTIVFAGLIVLMVLSCKENAQQPEKASEENKEVVQDSIKVISGEFFYTDEAAVLMGKSFIYGVVIDSLAKELNEKTKRLKREEMDMVPVVIRGKVDSSKNAEGWKELVTIKEIIKVSPPKKEDAVKLSSNKKN